MRHRHISDFSKAELASLPIPIITDVDFALHYANQQVFTQIRSRSPTLPPLALPMTTASPNVRSSRSCHKGEELEKKSTFVTDTTPIVDEKTDEQPEPPLLNAEISLSVLENQRSSIFSPVEAGVQVSDQVGVKSLLTETETQTVDLEKELAPQTAETSTDISSPVRRRKTRPAKDSSFLRLSEEYAEKQRKFASVAMEIEALDQLEKEKKAKEAMEKKAKVVKERKEKLIEKYRINAEERRAREVQRQEAELNYRKVKSVLPLYERISATFQAHESRSNFEKHAKLQEMKAKRKPIDLKEMQEHENWYENKREDLISAKRKARETRLKHIKEDNSSQVYFQSPLLVVDEEEKRLGEEAKRAKSERGKEMLFRQRIYADLAQELHRPRTFLPSPQVSSVRKPRKLNASSIFSSPVRKNSKSHFTPRRTPRPSITPSPEPKGTVRDYNKEHREASERALLNTDKSSLLFNYQPSLHESEVMGVEELRMKAGKLTREARQREGLIGRLEQDPELLVQACDSVSSMYLDVIKAKMQLVHSMCQ